MDSIASVKHVVILMQENRSFDHYFGTLPGVRGFYYPNGVFAQQFLIRRDRRAVYPFRMAGDAGQTAGNDLDHGWNALHTAWNGGAMNGWGAAELGLLYGRRHSPITSRLRGLSPSATRISARCWGPRCRTVSS